MEIKKRIKIKCLEKNITFVEIAKKIGISRQNYNEKLNRKDEVTIKKTEEILKLPSGFFK